MKRLHVINPTSGVKHSPNLMKQVTDSGEAYYVTTGVGDAERFVYETCLADPETHFIVYGGDGTINEAISGILRADAGRTAVFSVVPTGTGNDFVRSFPEQGREYWVDAMKYGDRYAVNILNTGFDCRVVVKTAAYKKLFPGSAAYIAGVAHTFFHRIGEHWQLEIEDETGKVEVWDETFTLAFTANGRYYGGGFHAAPLSDPSDGLMDFLAIKKVSRLTFLKLIGDYKKGTHLDPATRQPYPKFEKYVMYRRCRRVKLVGLSLLCADGEVEPRKEAEITVLPKALRYVT